MGSATSRAVSGDARTGGADAGRVTCCARLGLVSGVGDFCGDRLPFRMSSIMESTVGRGGFGPTSLVCATVPIAANGASTAKTARKLYCMNASEAHSRLTLDAR